MSSSDRLLLILHIGFAIFAIGPLTAATMASPRQIRRGEVRVLRHLIRTTRIYGLATLGMFLFGILLAHGRFQPWLVVSITLFGVAVVLLLIVDRDQRRAAHKLELAVARAVPRPAAQETADAPALPAAPPGTTVGPAAAEPATPAAEDAASAGTARPAARGGAPAQADAGDATGAPDSAASASSPHSTGSVGTTTGSPESATAPNGAEIAQVEQGRIAALSGVVALIWLVSLVLMVAYA